MEFTKSEAKKWAKQHLKGLEATILPSYTPDMEELDEEGIRWDVNHLAKQGFSAVFCSVETQGMTFEERKKFVEIVNHEAKGKIHVSVAIVRDTIKQGMELLKHHEKCGGTLALIYFPPQYYPETSEEICTPRQASATSSSSRSREISTPPTSTGS